MAVICKEQFSGRRLPPCTISMGLLLLLASYVPLGVYSVRSTLLLEADGDENKAETCPDGEFVLTVEKKADDNNTEKQGENKDAGQKTNADGDSKKNEQADPNGVKQQKQAENNDSKENEKTTAADNTKPGDQAKDETDGETNKGKDPKAKDDNNGQTNKDTTGKEGPKKTSTLIEAITCKKCEASCKTCEDAADQCTSCIDGKFLNDDAECDDCEDPCATCSSSSSTCTGCKDNLTLTGSKCEDPVGDVKETKSEANDTMARGRASFRLKVLMSFVALTSLAVLGFAVYSLYKQMGVEDEED